jgi:hypothetical protein
MDELTEYVDFLDSLLKRFVSGGNFGMFLKSEDQGLYMQKVMEATSIINDLLGDGNQYTTNIIHTTNESSRGFVGGPSYAGVQGVRGIILAAQTEIDRKRNTGPKAIQGGADDYVAETRLQELKDIRSSRFDLTRLIRLCEEVNVAYRGQAYLSIAMLLRAIIDHVPPIFGFKTFAEVANNYNGAISFKQAMQHLGSALRAVADAHLHIQIRKKESLPELPQVDFRSPLDSLLGEIIRLLKQ